MLKNVIYIHLLITCQNNYYKNAIFSSSSIYLIFFQIFIPSRSVHSSLPILNLSRGVSLSTHANINNEPRNISYFEDTQSTGY